MKALLLTGLQNDFMPGGTCPVPQGDQVISVANKLMPRFKVVVALQDWHPPDHVSFATNHPGRKPGDVIELAGQPQVLWPVHGVANTPGADLVAALHRLPISHIIRKGTDPAVECYSGFFDNGHHHATGLDEYLKGHHISELYLMGLATDYSVKFTAIDGRQLGYDVCVFTDGCRGLNLKEGDVGAALAEMQRMGVRFLSSGDYAGDTAPMRGFI